MDKDVKFFLKTKREEVSYRPVKERIKDYQEVFFLPAVDKSKQQSSRCMDCGTPFCHWACPLGNYIPEWNDLVSRGQWEKAFILLEAANIFPEITARLCPALCEYACVLGINDEAVTIRENELAVIEYAFKHKLIKPKKVTKRAGKKTAVVGSGPAGLAAAVNLNRAGHTVVVFEKDSRLGGLLRYGIPDFKLDKSVLERRFRLWKKEGIIFEPGVNIGCDYPVEKLLKEFDSVCLAIGAGQARDLNITGRAAKGIYFAMDFLVQSNRRIAGEKISEDESIDAAGRKVVVIGGGDTGADCVGTAIRQGASKVTQIELLPKPSIERTRDYPWPLYPVILKISSSHEEGVERLWSVETKEFICQDNKLKSLACIKTDSSEKDNRFYIEVDMAILAIGFTGPKITGLVEQLGLELDQKGNIKTDSSYQSCRKGVFCAGDARRGQSLIVWALKEGHQAAKNIKGDRHLFLKADLP